MYEKLQNRLCVHFVYKSMKKPLYFTLTQLAFSHLMVKYGGKISGVDPYLCMGFLAYYTEVQVCMSNEETKNIVLYTDLSLSSLFS